jgi:hypothetical protein
MLKSLTNETRCGVSLLLLGLVVGCAPLSLPKSITLPGHGEKPQSPLKMTALWTDTVLVEAGVAGFGGRVMFYGKSEDKPIMVEGELTVYAYDDSDGGPDNSVPARKYVFRTEELSNHYSKSSLGHSYSFWLPWGNVGGPQRQISLIARFKSKAGGVVMSEMTHHFLPGAPSPSVSQKQGLPRSGPSPARKAYGVQQAAHEEPAEEQPDDNSAMTTTTIALPPRLGSRWARPSAETQSALPALDAAGSQSELKTLADAAGRQAETADSQALAREIRALRESLDSKPPETAPADRFGRRRYRARIEPRLPPTRDPARTQLRPAEPPSGPPPTPLADSSNESLVNPASAQAATSQWPQAASR